MKIKEDEKSKAVFKTCYDQFEYQVIFFGLSNVSASFQYYIIEILVKKLEIFVFLYLDNI